METRYGSRSARRLTAPGINPERAPKGDAVTGEEGRPSESEAWHHVGCHECEEEEHYSTFLTKVKRQSDLLLDRYMYCMVRTHATITHHSVLCFVLGMVLSGLEGFDR